MIFILTLRPICWPLFVFFPTKKEDKSIGPEPTDKRLNCEVIDFHVVGNVRLLVCVLSLCRFNVLKFTKIVAIPQSTLLYVELINDNWNLFESKHKIYDYVKFDKCNAFTRKNRELMAH